MVILWEASFPSVSKQIHGCLFVKDIGDNEIILCNSHSEYKNTCIMSAACTGPFHLTSHAFTITAQFENLSVSSSADGSVGNETTTTSMRRIHSTRGRGG